MQYINQKSTEDKHKNKQYTLKITISRKHKNAKKQK